METVKVTLRDGRVVELQEPTAGSLRGISTLNVVLMLPEVHAKLIPRISELSESEFWSLRAADVFDVMAAAASFFGGETSTDAYLEASRTPGSTSP